MADYNDIEEFIRRKRIGNIDSVEGPILPPSTFMPPSGPGTMFPDTPLQRRGYSNAVVSDPNSINNVGDPTVMGAPKTTDPEFMTALEALRAYVPDTRASDRLNQLLDQYPEHEDPSIIRRAIASGLGLGGDVNQALKFLHQPHEEKLADWAAKVGPTNQAATQERGTNANERSILATLASAEGVGRRYDIAEQKNREDAAIQREKIALDKFKAEHPGWKFSYAGPTVIASDPLTGRSVDLGVKTGRLSDIDKIDEQTEGRIEVVQAQGAQNRQTQAERPPTAASGRSAQIQQNMDREKLYNTHPDGRKWLIKKSDGTYELKKPPTAGGYFGSTPEEIANYDEFRRLLYPDWDGGVQPINPPKGTTVGPSVRPQTQGQGTQPSKGQDTGADTVVVEDLQTHQLYTIPRQNLPRALAIKPARYRVVSK